MNAIFWDVDGVLNDPGVWGQWIHGDWSKALRPTMIKKAVKVCRELNAKCVLSSSWRINGYSRTLDAFKHAGWDTVEDDFLGRTPHLNLVYGRGREISLWLDDNPCFGIDRFVIVDDASDMDPVTDHWVQTNGAIGLTDAVCEQIVQRMNSPSAMFTSPLLTEAMRKEL